MPAFQVGRFQVRTWRRDGRWGVSIDGSEFPSWYMTEAQAAGAGLLAAHRLLGTIARPPTGEREAVAAEA